MFYCFKIFTPLLEVRLDKWLWSMRLFKTRTLAAEACKKGHVYVDGVSAKASKMVKVGDIINLKRSPVLFSFKVKNIPNNRLGAKLVSDYMENVTTADQLHLWELILLDKSNSRAKGLGRPTKKERRELNDFIEDVPYYIDDDIDLFGEDE